MIDFIIGIKGSDFLIFYPLVYVLPVLVLTLICIELIARKKEEKDIFMDDLTDFDLLVLKKLRDKNHIIKYYLLKYFNEGIATLGKDKGYITKGEKISSYKGVNRVERKLKEILEKKKKLLLMKYIKIMI